MDFCLLWVLCVCQIEVSATGWSLVQRSPTDCVVSKCVISKPQEWGDQNPQVVVKASKIIIIIILVCLVFYITVILYGKVGIMKIYNLN
jgi:hypothetical protein